MQPATKTEQQAQSGTHIYRREPAEGEGRANEVQVSENRQQRPGR